MRTRCVTHRTLDYTIVARGTAFEVLGRNRALEATPRVKILLTEARQKRFAVLASTEQSSTS